MIEFLDFELKGDRFYEAKTLVPFTNTGLTLLRGKNFDASADGSASNGTGKTRLLELFVGFITGKSPRGNFKKVVTNDFQGTLTFKTKTDTWSFSYTPSLSVDAWVVHKNGQKIKVSHKPSDCQEMLQKKIGFSREDFNYFVFINQRSLDVLIKGKPSEKKAYLEGFFNIDTFYSNTFDKYKTEFLLKKDKLQELKNDRIKLDTINEARRDLHGSEWLRLQIENCDESLLLLKTQISQINDSQSELKKNIDVWNQYHALFTKLQGLDANRLKLELATLNKAKHDLDLKIKSRQQLVTLVKLKLNPHESRKPTSSLSQPVFDKPDTTLITTKGIALNQMQDKMRLKKQITPLTKELEELRGQLQGVATAASIDTRKAELYKERMDNEEHLNLLLKGGDVCLTCKQPLTFILEGKTVDERKALLASRIKAIKEEEKDCVYQAALIIKADKLNQQILTLQEQFARYPNFGVKLSDAELELKELKDTLSSWEAYEKEQDTILKWQSTYDLLLLEAKNLGYPEILEEDFSTELQTINERLPTLTDDLKQFDRFDALTEAVISLIPLTSLEEQEKEGREDLTILFSRIDALNEIKGGLRSQLENLISLNAQAKVLEEKVAGQEEAESECKILEMMTSFYSPTGFKVYELKKRSQKLIDRSNYWSKLFFQEPYHWSLSEDLDDLDFFIQPTNDASTEPYPIALLSAGEYNRAARVLLFSQLELIPPNKKTNLLILDEIEGHLDDAGITAFTEVVLPKLKETFPDKSIVVISHQTSLQKSGHIDHLWLAERKDRKTKLSVHQNYQRRIG